MLHFGPIAAITRKDLLLLARDKSNAFFTFIFPLLVALFFGSIFGGGGPGGKLDLALVDLDHTPAAQAFIKDLKADDALHIIDESAPGTPLTPDTATSLVRKGGAVAAITVPKGFGDGAQGLFAGGSMHLETTIAPGHDAEAGLLTGKLNELAFKQLSRTFGDTKAMNASLDKARDMLRQSKDLDPARRALFEAMFSSIGALNKDQPLIPSAKPDADNAANQTSGPGGWRPVDVSIHTLQDSSLHPTSTWEISFPQGVVWGLMGCVMAFGTSITAERSRGTLQRLTIAPVTKSDILAGKALACFITCVIVQCIMLGMATIVFHVRPSNPLMMAASIAVTSLGFVGVMMLIAGMSRTEGSAQGLARALLLMLAMIGGGSVPTFFLPAIIQKFSLISPFTWAMRALEGALWRHSSWPEFAFPAAILLAIAVVGYIVGVTGLRWGENA